MICVYIQWYKPPIRSIPFIKPTVLSKHQTQLRGKRWLTMRPKVVDAVASAVKANSWSMGRFDMVI